MNNLKLGDLWEWQIYLKVVMLMNLSQDIISMVIFATQQTTEYTGWGTIIIFKINNYTLQIASDMNSKILKQDNEMINTWDDCTNCFFDMIFLKIESWED